MKIPTKKFLVQAYRFRVGDMSFSSEEAFEDIVEELLFICRTLKKERDLNKKQLDKLRGVK